MAPLWRSLFGSISSTLDWNPFFRMALAWRTMWKSLLSVRNGTTFPPWLFHGALLVDFLFNVRLDTISSLTLLKGMALPWRPHGARRSAGVARGIAPAWRSHGARRGASMALAWRIRGIAPRLCSFYSVFRHVCLPSVGACYANWFSTLWRAMGLEFAWCFSLFLSGRW